MKIAFFLSSENIENFKNLLKRSAGERRSVIEFCWGDVVLLENEPCGHCMFLENISLIEFFCDLKTFLVSHKMEKNTEDVIMDMNQSYGFNLLKVGNSLTIETYSEEYRCKVDSDYDQALHRVRFASQTFFKDLLYHCPQLEGTEEGDYLREMLM